VQAKKQRPQNGTGRFEKPSLINALKNNRQGFKNDKIYFIMYRDLTTRAQNKSAEAFLKQDTASAASQLRLSKADLQKVDWYANFKGIPNDAFLVDCRLNRAKCKVGGVYRTFLLNTNQNIRVDGDVERFTFAVTPKYADFRYKLTAKDKALIEKRIKSLWKKGRGDNTGKLIRLYEASPFLFGK
jgi:hypothetical protein